MSLFLSIQTVLRVFFVEGNIFVNKKYLKYFAYYCIPAFLLVLFFFFRTVFMQNFLTFGTITYTLLLIILFVKPLASLFPDFRILMTLVSLRRPLGITTFHFVFAHFLGFAALNSFFAVAVPTPSNTPAIFFGFLALVVLFVLYLTSNPFSVRLLKRNWKRLQRIAYLALLLAVIHVSFIRSDSLSSYLSVVLLYSVFLILKILEWRKIKIPLSSTLVFRWLFASSKKEEKKEEKKVIKSEENKKSQKPSS